MGQISLQVVPNSSVQALEFLAPLAANRNGPASAPILKVRLKQKAQGGRANLALEKWLSALSGFPVRIVRGHAGRRKTVAFSRPEEEFLQGLRAGLAREQEGQ